MNPLDYVPDHVKWRLIDKGLTRLASAAERSGSAKLAQTLRELRTDRPFVEDVVASLELALASFERVWHPRDPQLTEMLMAESDLWHVTDFLGSLAGALLHPSDQPGSDIATMRAILSEYVADRVPEDRMDAGLVALVAAVREQMFAHPKLHDVHSLYLQKAMLRSQTAMLETLEGIRQGLGSTGRPAISATADAFAPTALEAAEQPDPAPAANSAPATGCPIDVSIQTSEHKLPDVLTPTLDGRRLVVPSYAPIVGKEAALWLGDLQLQVTATIEQADFVGQQRLAERLLDQDLGIPDLRASGYYLLGEAKRLQADFSDDTERTNLLESASDAYNTAFELNGSIRALRGLGRVQEVRGDLGAALQLYERARIGALMAYKNGNGRLDSESAHEVLRSTRHYVACAAQIGTDSVNGAALRHSKLVQLHGAIEESQELHYTVLPGFSANNEWMQIEWFMGLVLLARAYVIVDDHHQAWLCLAHALNARMAMMDDKATAFTVVERENLRWWLRTAHTVKSPSHDFNSQVDALRASVETPDAVSAWQIMPNIVSPVRSPWLIRRKGI